MMKLFSSLEQVSPRPPMLRKNNRLAGFIKYDRKKTAFCFSCCEHLDAFVMYTVFICILKLLSDQGLMPNACADIPVSHVSVFDRFHSGGNVNSGHEQGKTTLDTNIWHCICHSFHAFC